MFGTCINANPQKLGFNTLLFLSYPFCRKSIPSHFHAHDRTLAMVDTPLPKRPFCLSCSKPAQLCLCNRIKTPLLENPIPITILQHSHEKNHPLNSTRIALLGFKNIKLLPVSDVHFQAQFLIYSLKPNCSTASNGTVTKADFDGPQNHLEKPGLDQISAYPILDQDPKTTVAAPITESSFKSPQYRPGKPGFDQISAHSIEKESDPILKSDPQTTITTTIMKNYPKESNFNQVPVSPIVQEVPIGKPGCETAISGKIGLTSYFTHLETTHIEPVSRVKPVPETIITATIAKRGFTCSLTHLQTNQSRPMEPDFDRLLDSPTAKEVISNGFYVKRLQRKQLADSMEFEDFVEFEIAIPPGSCLLFPSAKSISFGSIDFEVKHLVVLDGTWAKAKRMYHENPWLKLLPHLKLDPSKISLYSEVRQQPKAGCLSTIESIVCALKALGDDNVALDDLLSVFESMVGDQRRCKDERLSTMSQPNLDI